MKQRKGMNRLNATAAHLCTHLRVTKPRDFCIVSCPGLETFLYAEILIRYYYLQPNVLVYRVVVQFNANLGVIPNLSYCVGFIYIGAMIFYTRGGITDYLTL